MEKFELLPQKKGKGYIISKKRVLLGRAETCDVVIPHPSVSSIHAVLEIDGNEYKLYDMNSTNGTFVGDKKIVSSKIREGDVVRFSKYDFLFKKYSPEDVPPVLDMLDSSDTQEIDLPPEERTKVLPKEEMPKVPIFEKKEPSKKLPDSEKKTVPQVVYPLASDPKAEMSEYIFEDADSLYPIFRYEVEKESVEVIILFEDRIYSVDYLPFKKGIYYLKGFNPGESEMEYPRLPKEERLPFIEFDGGGVSVHSLRGYQGESIPGGEIKQQQIHLADEDIVRMIKDEVQIFIRRSPAPPFVKPAPFFRRDKELRKYLFLILAFVFAFIWIMSSFNVNKEIEKEKNPERIATILYKKKIYKKKKKTLAPKPKAEPKPLQKPKVKPKPTPKPEPKPTPKPEPKPTPKPKLKLKPKPRPKPKPVVKKVIKKPPLKAVTKPKRPLPKKRPGKISKIRKAAPAKIKKIVKTKPRPSKVVKATKSKSLGRVDSYKAVNFKSSINSLLSKGGSVSGIKSIKSSSSALDTSHSSVGGGEGGGTLKTAKIKSKVGSISGVASGRLDSGSGSKGIVNKKDIYTSGIPHQTVILGGMDPDIIKKILIEHLPQFRYCYQKELDRASKSFNGMVRMDFVIGASGHVSKAGLLAVRGNLPVPVKSCVIRVLKGIRFPEPAGGGIVEVSQPFNFYPRLQ